MALNPQLADWQGRRTWLVGASTGIGAALAEELRQRGARLAISARDGARVTELAQRLGALALPCDVTREDELGSAAAALHRAWGGLDVVVYLAGRYTAMRADGIDLTEVRRSVDTNLIGAYATIAAALPRLAPASGSGIVLVSSVAGYRGLPRALAYGPTKAALINLAEILYLDLAPRGIGVFVVNPGFVRTPMTAANDFDMPALIEPRDAAMALLDGLADGRFEIHFPRRFTGLLRLLRRLPDRLWFPLVRRVTRA